MSQVDVGCAFGTVRVDVETGEWDIADVELTGPAREACGLPLLRATQRCGSRVVAVVTSRPPLMISDDSGATWRASARGLPAGVDVAFLDGHPDVVVFATEERLYVSRDGGRFWRDVPVELPGIWTVAPAPEGVGATTES